MARLWPVCVLAGLLIATTLFVGVPAFGRAATPSGSAPAAPLAGSDTVQATNRFGAPQTVFYVGLTSGAVYFAATDPNTGDSSANVSLIDQNATRDGLTNPVRRDRPGAGR